MKKRGFIKRIAAITALSLVLTELPVFPAKEIEAAQVSEDKGSSYYVSELGTDGKYILKDPTTEKTTEGTTEDKTIVKTYSIKPDPDDEEKYSDYGAVSAWKDRQSIQAPSNTYCMHVGTGATQGDTVLYYAIEYTDVNDVTRTQFVFPSIDAKDRSDALLKYGANGKALNQTYGGNMLKEFNYSEDLQSEDPLAAWSVQDYVFQTDAEVKKVDNIKIYLGQGSWNIQGLEIYKVDSYKGYEEYGIVSGKQFLDFEGYKVSEVVKTNSQVTFSTSGADAVIVIGESEDVNQYCTLKNFSKGESEKKYAVENYVYSFRMDFVDQMDAGIETFANSNGQKVDSFKDNIVEDIVIEFQYKDKSGWTRKVALPVILSSYGCVLEKEKNGTILGFGQRGDTLAFMGLFPDMDYIVGNVTLSVGKAARDRLAESGINVSNGTGSMKQSMNNTTTDDIQIAGISFYKGACMPYIQDGIDSDGKKVQGATIDYAFEGSPFTYFTTTDERGRLVKPGGKEQFKLTAYKSGATLTASSSARNKFLVTVSTSNIKKCGTTNDVTMRFKYDTRDGQHNKTTLYNVKNAAVEYMGTWPATNGKDFIGSIALTEGSTISFLIDAINLKQFTGVDVNLLGDDEWQLNNLTIDYVERFEKRHAYVVDKTVSGVTTHFWIDRSMVSAQIFNMGGSAVTVLDKAGDAVYGNGSKIQNNKKPLTDKDGKVVTDKDGNPVYIDADDVVEGRAVGDEQFFAGGTGYSFNFTNNTTVEDVDRRQYKDVLYVMSYEDTAVDWGFFKEAKTFDVTVKVADDPDYDNGDGDSGSKNYFYFQLDFSNGNSAYVLANQQLTADGFRSGKSETFTIKTNRDYGDLLGVRIIPEDLSSETDVFDKLNIEKITITEKTSGGAFMNYVIDNVGWIEIDYRDELESVTPGGQKARMQKEISRYFNITDKQKSVRLLCEIVTLPWDNDYLQFQGSVMAEVVYVSSETKTIQTMSFDVVQYIAEYMNKTAKSVETSTDPNSQVVKAAGLNTISDPEWMFRPNHTDRLIFPAIPDLGTIKSIQFTAQTRNGYPAIWNIGQITLSQITSDSGSIQLTTNEEYLRDIDAQELCRSTNSKVVSTTLPIGKAQRTSVFNFTDNQIVWVSDAWATPVSRIPESNSDTVNVYLHPSPGSYNVDDVNVSISYQYGIPFSKYMQISYENLYTSGSGTEDAIFYVRGLKAANFVSPGKLEVQCTNTYMAFDYAVVQHERNGVIIDTYEYYFFDSSAILGIEASPSSRRQYTDRTEEKVILDFGKDTEEQNLVPETNDIAVAVHYTSTIDPTGYEYTSPYVYLTDVGYKTISEGLWAEIPFKVNNVDKVTGYSIAAYGNLKGTIDESAIYAYDISDENDSQSLVTLEEEALELTFKNYAPVMESYKLTDNLKKHKSKVNEYYGPDTVTPIFFDFTTASATTKGEGGTRAKIKATFHYIDYRKVERTKTYDDLSQYIIGKNKEFLTNETQTVKIFLEEMGSEFDLISVELLPYFDTIVTEKDISEVVEDAANEKEEEDAKKAEAEKNGETPDAKIDDPDNPSAETILEKTIENQNASWTIHSVKVTIADGQITPLERKVEKTFSGLQQGGEIIFNSASLISSINQNGTGDYTITSVPPNFLAKKDDIFTGKVTVINSLNGFGVKVYRKVGDAREDITQDNIVIDNAANKFWFVVPESKDPYNNTVYELAIYPKDDPDTQDIVYVTVEKTKEREEATTENTTESTTEGTTEKSTEESTGSQQDNTESNTDQNNDQNTDQNNDSNTESGTADDTNKNDSDGFPSVDPVESN